MNIDSLLSTFNFKYYNYGIAFDEVQSGWIQRVITGKQTWKRYWIFRKSKFYHDDRKQIEVFCEHLDLWDRTHYLFYEPSTVGGKKKIIYFHSLHEPVTLLEGLKAKLDEKSLGDHTLFNTKDLGW